MNWLFIKLPIPIEDCVWTFVAPADTVADVSTFAALADKAAAVSTFTALADTAADD